MGPVSQHNLTIAPAFYVTQVDLCGPFDSYAPHNKRKTVKIWLTVFCCATTSTTSTKTMDDYGISSFIQGSYFVTLVVNSSRVATTQSSVTCNRNFKETSKSISRSALSVGLFMERLNERSRKLNCQSRRSPIINASLYYNGRRYVISHNCKQD